MLPKIGFCSFLFVAFCLFCTPVHAADFKDLEAKFAYDGNETMTFELCNPTDSDITYYDGFERNSPSWLMSYILNKQEKRDHNIIDYSFISDVKGGQHRIPDNSEFGNIVLLKHKGCKRHKLHTSQITKISGGTFITRYKFRVLVTLYKEITLKETDQPSFGGDPRFARPPIKHRPEYDHVTFESPVYDYKPNIHVEESLPFEQGEAGVYPIENLEVDLVQDGQKTVLKVCNRTDGLIVFRDHLYLNDDKKEPFGVYIDYRTKQNDSVKTTSMLFYNNFHYITYEDKPPRIKIPSQECRTKIVDILPVIKGIEDQSASMGKPLKITQFRPYVALSDEHYDQNPALALRKFSGEWVNVDEITGTADALDYHNLTVQFKDSDEGLEIQVCNPKDKPVIFQDSLFLDQPNKKPFGVLAEVQYDSLLSNYEMFERVFYPVSLPRVREARMEPGECKSKTVDLGHALSVFLRDNEEYKQSGRQVMKYRAVVVLFEKVWNFKYAKLPHRVFHSEWMRYNPTSMHDK